MAFPTPLLKTLSGLANEDVGQAMSQNSPRLVTHLDTHVTLKVFKKLSSRVFLYILVDATFQNVAFYKFQDILFRLEGGEYLANPNGTLAAESMAKLTSHNQKKNATMPMHVPQSLLSVIAPGRTCSQAGLPPYHCACMQVKRSLTRAHSLTAFSLARPCCQDPSRLNFAKSSKDDPHFKVCHVSL